MKKSQVKIRLMQAADRDAVVEIDEKILNASRADYFEMKFEMLFESKDCIPTSLVAEDDQGKVVGFVIGTLFMGEFGIYEEQATLDTLGVDPRSQHHGIGSLLINEFVGHLRSLGVKKLNTLVNVDDTQLSHFFAANGFVPSRTVNLERTL